VFSVALVVFAALLSVLLYGQRVGTFQRVHPYEWVAGWMEGRVPLSARVMVNDPPTFYYFARRPSVVIPNGDLEMVRRAMEQYEAQFLVLDANNPKLCSLYDAPDRDDRLVLRAESVVSGNKVLVFEVQR
jgi:hypothetical protein